VSKAFADYTGMFVGTIADYDDFISGHLRVDYEDGDAEDLTLDEVMEIWCLLSRVDWDIRLIRVSSKKKEK
jgi:hypothetical protein